MKVIIVVIWTLFLLAVLFAPIGSVLPPSIIGPRYFDKIAHFFLFGATVVISIYCASHHRSFEGRILFGLIFTLVIALVTEVGQSLLPYRSPSFFDLTADLLGLFAGMILYVLLYNIRAIRTFLRL